MKVHRIRLRDYKGVDDVEVEFALDGVTIIEGPNEVGKTSLAEALTLVLEQLDSSSRARYSGREACAQRCWSVGRSRTVDRAISTHH